MLKIACFFLNSITIFPPAFPFEREREKNRNGLYEEKNFPSFKYNQLYSLSNIWRASCVYVLLLLLLLSPKQFSVEKKKKRERERVREREREKNFHSNSLASPCSPVPQSWEKLVNLFSKYLFAQRKTSFPEVGTGWLHGVSHGQYRIMVVFIVLYSIL